jgi:hypothetical protein
MAGRTVKTSQELMDEQKRIAAFLTGGKKSLQLAERFFACLETPEAMNVRDNDLDASAVTPPILDFIMNIIFLDLSNYSLRSQFENKLDVYAITHPRRLIALKKRSPNYLENFMTHNLLKSLTKIDTQKMMFQINTFNETEQFEERQKQLFGGLTAGVATANQNQ